MCCSGRKDDENAPAINCDEPEHWFHVSCLKSQYNYNDERIQKISQNDALWLCPYCTGEHRSKRQKLKR